MFCVKYLKNAVGGKILMVDVVNVKTDKLFLDFRPNSCGVGFFLCF